MTLQRALEQPPPLPMDDADPPTSPGRRVERRRPRGEGWRSVVTGALGMGVLAALTVGGYDAEGIAPYIVALAAVVAAGKDLPAVVEMIGRVLTTRRP